MSTSDIITIIKAINDNAINNYCESISGYFNQKTNVQELFERQFFNYVDQTVQKLINDIIQSLKSASSCQHHASFVPKHILALIQRQCITYNQRKKNIYDNHLAKIKEFEKKFCGIVEQMLREKGVHQNTLFDIALRNEVTTDNVNQDIVNLLNICQNNPNATQNTSNMNVSSATVQNASNTAQNTSNTNVSSITDIQNAFASPMKTLSPNHINKPNEINQFLSFISQIMQNTPSNTNVTSNTETDRNDDNVFNVIRLNNSNVSDNNNNNKNQTGDTNVTHAHNTCNEKNCVSNNHASSSQLKKLKEPVYSESKVVPLQTNVISNDFDNLPPNILPSFPITNIMNNNVNSVNTNSNNRNTFPHSDTTSQISGTQFSMNVNDGCNKPSAPPKPPPPTFIYDEPSNMSQSDNNDDNDDNGYECTLCNIMFDSAKEWKTHLRKAHLKTHRKKKKLNQSKHKKNKRIRKRSFNKMINDSNINNDIVSTFNKRRRQITYQCEQHDNDDKQYSHTSSYSTHYNHRKENTKDLQMLKLLSLRGIKKNDR